MDLGDDRLGDGLHGHHHLGAAVEKVFEISLSAVFGLTSGSHLFEVVAGAEDFAFAREHDSAHAGVVFERLERVLHRGEHLVGERIQAFGEFILRYAIEFTSRRSKIAILFSSGFAANLNRNALGGKTMSVKMTPQEMETYLAEIFPQVSDDFAVEVIDESGCVMRLKTQEKHLRPGGTVSGPSMFALADVAAYVATMGQIGRVALAVTTNCSLDSCASRRRQGYHRKATLSAGRTCR